jgi:hypothetical protein
MTRRVHPTSLLLTMLLTVLMTMPAMLPMTGCLDASADASADDVDGDNSGIICAPNLPPPSDPCLPVCGNELGVGQPCTRGGYECPAIDVGNEATFCTVDFEATDLAFCTRPCFDDLDCGSDAFCTGDPQNPDSDKGCTPSACR